MNTVEESFQGVLEEKKSRFIGVLLPYSSFEQTLAELRKEHPKANHFISAFRYINENNQIVEGSRDDGEPSGTSGPPVLKTLQGHGLINVGAIVVRYFGGTKLGKGGLSRAYSGGIKKAIENSKFVSWVKLSQKEVQVAFNDVSKFEDICSQSSLDIVKRDYNERGTKFTILGAEVLVKEALALIQPY